MPVERWLIRIALCLEMVFEQIGSPVMVAALGVGEYGEVF
jgi:hypothetical protein